MSSPVLVRRAQAGFKQARRLSVSDTKPGDSSSRQQTPARSQFSSKNRWPPEISLVTDSPHAAVSPDNPPTPSRGMATVTSLPTTATVVGLQPKCPVTNMNGLSIKPSPVVTFDGAGPFSSPCVGLDLTVAERASTDAVGLRYKFRSSSSQMQSDRIPLVDVPLTSHQDWTRVRLGATELEYQSSPLSDDSSDAKRVVVRTKMTTTSPSLSSVKVHSVFIVQNAPGSGPQVQHVLPSHPLFHDS